MHSLTHSLTHSLASVRAPRPHHPTPPTPPGCLNCLPQRAYTTDNEIYLLETLITGRTTIARDCNCIRHPAHAHAQRLLSR
jgi:hypothetical protein